MKFGFGGFCVYIHMYICIYIYIKNCWTYLYFASYRPFVILISYYDSQMKLYQFSKQIACRTKEVILLIELIKIYNFFETFFFFV